MEKISKSSAGAEIIAGTYEHFVVGYKFEENEDEELLPEQSFAVHSHLSSVRCLAVSGKYLASGSSDEKIIIYDLHLRKQAGELTHHTGTITCLDFTPSGSHLISCSDDGTLCIIRTGSWMVEATHKHHFATVKLLAMRIHPSEKLLIAVNKDNIISTWDLVRGRLIFVNSKFRHQEKDQILKILWHPDGMCFILVFKKTVYINEINNKVEIASVNFSRSITCAVFLGPEIICFGTEDGFLCVYKFDTLKSNEQLFELQAHTERIKDVIFLKVNNELLLASGSSTGIIKLWKFKDNKLCEVAEAKCGCRITCLAAVGANVDSHQQRTKGKSQSEEEDTICNSEKTKQTTVDRRKLVQLENDSQSDDKILVKAQNKKITKRLSGSDIRRTKKKRIILDSNVKSSTGQWIVSDIDK